MQRFVSIVFSLGLLSCMTTLQAEMQLKVADTQGREAAIDVVGIGKQGLIYRNAQQKVATLEWERLDMGYIEKNYPQLHEVYRLMQQPEYAGADRVAIENVLSSPPAAEQKSEQAQQVDAKLKPLLDTRAALLAKLQECDGKLARCYRTLMLAETYAPASYKQRCHVNGELLELIKALEDCNAALKLVDDSAQKSAFSDALSRALATLQQINAAPAIPKKEWIRSLEPLAKSLGL